jgi:hypothetical protein
LSDIKKHTLVAIGYLGSKRVYLDLPVEEAARRYVESEKCGVIDGIPVEVVPFDDEFYAYEVG